MRHAIGRAVPVNGRSVYVEERGVGDRWVVFESGSGQGRTSWDLVVPQLTDQAHLVAYDRAGFGRSGRIKQQLGINDMAADLVALIDAIVPDGATLVLVGHSMGGLICRRAAERLGARLGGLLLVDPTPETAPVYDTFDRTAKQVDLSLAIGQPLMWIRPVAWLSTGNIRRVYPRETYATMLGEDFTPAGIGQTRKEFKAVAAAIHEFRAAPPILPECPTVILSATRPLRRGSQPQTLGAHQRRWVESLPNGRFESVDCSHFIQAEQPELVAESIRQLLTGSHQADGRASSGDSLGIAPSQ